MAEGTVGHIMGTLMYSGVGRGDRVPSALFALFCSILEQPLGGLNVTGQGARPGEAKVLQIASG